MTLITLGLRVIVTALRAHSVVSLTSSNPLQTLTYLTSLNGLILFVIGLIVMTKERGGATAADGPARCPDWPGESCPVRRIRGGRTRPGAAGPDAIWPLRIGASCLGPPEPIPRSRFFRGTSPGMRWSYDCPRRRSEDTGEDLGGAHLTRQGSTSSASMTCAKVSAPSWHPTSIRSPGPNLPDRIACASGFSNWARIARRRGRAP